MQWEIEPGVSIEVLLIPGGPKDSLTAPFDITDQVRKPAGITISRGRSNEVEAFDMGSCELELRNDNRQFDPTNASSPYITALKPNRALIVRATYEAVTYTLFAGFIEGWPQRQGAGDLRPTVPIVANDWLAILYRTRLSEVAFVLDRSRLDIDPLSGDLPEQRTGERVLSAIGLAGLSPHLVGASAATIDDGVTTMPAYSGDDDLLSVCRAAEKAEAGFFYAAKDGPIVFLERHARFQDPRLATTQATFSDCEFGEIEVDHDLTRTWNDVRFARPGGAGQTARDETSIATYGQLTYPQSGDAETIEVLSDGQAIGRAQFWVDRYGEPLPRPSPVTIWPRHDMPALFPAVAGRELCDRVEITRTPQGVGSPVTYTGLIDHLEHRILSYSWATTVSISPFDIQDNTGFLELDEIPEGELDTARLAY